MQLFQRRCQIPFIAFCASLFFISSQTAHALSTPPTSTTAPIIIVKEKGNAGAVIYRSQKSYYFGRFDGKRLIAKGQVVPGEFIVKMRSKDPGQAFQEKPSISPQVKSYVTKNSLIHETLNLTRIKLSNTKDYFKALQALKNDPNVEYVEPNYIATAQLIPNDPYYPQTWGPKAIEAEAAWDKVSSTQRAGVTIAILDTGVNASHEDFAGRMVPGYNFVDNTSNTNDLQGHGTHVAGIAAAVANNSKGIAGIAGGSKIMPVKVLGDNGSGSYSAIIAGIKYATDHGADVINMSLGGPGTSTAMQDAVNYALQRGVHVVAASGNSNSAVVMPGNLQGVITVGAIESTGTRASYSNYGPQLDVMAPGSQILSTYIGGSTKYSTMSGTSMATPFVTGVIGLLEAINPKLSPSAIESMVRQSAKDLGVSGFDNMTGYGLINTNKAVDLALRSVGTAPSPTPSPTPAPAPQPAPTPTPSPAPTPTTNLALNKPAFASSVEGTTRTAAMAFDGNASTRWASRPYIDPQWIYVDLGRSYNITKIVMKWEQAYAKAYELQISDDAQTWRSIYRTTSGMGGTTTLTGSIYGRFVRIYGTQRATSYGYSLWEMEVYGQ